MRKKEYKWWASLSLNEQKDFVSRHPFFSQMGWSYFLEHKTSVEQLYKYFNIDSMKTTVKLMWITSEGSEWLERNVTVTTENYKELVDNYIKETEEQAESLVDHWKRDGEYEVLTLYVEYKDDNQLYREVAAYVEYVDN